MLIFVQCNDWSIPLEVSLSDTIDSVKSKILTMEHIPKTKQILTFSGQYLQDHRQLNDYNIQHRSVLWLGVDEEAAETIAIIIKTPNDGDITLDVQTSDTIDTVKGVIHSYIEVSPGSLTLSFEGQQLEGGRTLSDYNIGNYSLLHM